MITPSREATSVKRPGAINSLSKNSRRHGAGNEARSIACTASRSPRTAGRIFSSPATAPLLQLHFRLREPNVDRRDVSVAIEFTRRRDSRRATCARCGNVFALEKIDDTQRVRIGVAFEMRWFRMRSETADVKLAASRVIDDRDRTFSRNRFMRRHRTHRSIERERETLDSGQSDAHTGARART